ncbi:MAG: DUF3429 domain-containing protein [Gammaproteobacteria bacterium]
MNDRDAATRRLAHVLGYAGLLPFLGATATLFLGDAGESAVALYALTIYAAVILSFMGAVHWGAAMQGAAGGPLELGLSVVPALVAWAAVTAAPPGLALAILALAFAVLLVADLLAVRASLLPRWYASLRVPLTVVVCACLALAAWRFSR